MKLLHRIWEAFWGKPTRKQLERKAQKQAAKALLAEYERKAARLAPPPITAAAAPAPLATVPACPICHAQDWQNAAEAKGGYQLAGCALMWAAGIPIAGIGMALTFAFGSVIPFLLAIGSMIFVVYKSMTQKRLYRQCRACQYRYQIQ